MRILIVDDAQRKIDQISDLVSRILPDIEPILDIARDAATAASMLAGPRYDLLVLDVDLPIRSGERSKPDGGLEILRLIRERKGYNRPGHIVGLSAYPDLIERYASDFQAEMWYLIGYSEQSNEWEQLLARKLVHVADALSPLKSGEYDFDLGIVTALPKLELEALLEIDAGWQATRFPGDGTEYHVGEFKRDNASLRVVAAAAGEVGMSVAATISMKLISRFKPRYLGMTGIAAGVSGQFGDIMVASHVWDYGSGKTVGPKGSPTEFLPAPTPLQLDPGLRSRIEAFGLQSRVLKEIQLEWDGDEASGTRLQLHIGGFGTGAAVVAARDVVDELIARDRKVVAVDMEAYAIFVAARHAPEPTPVPFVIKSVCDYGDIDKDDEFQRYAAYTSSRYMYRFAIDQLTRGK
jgi:nucleoside phosphorylase